MYDPFFVATGDKHGIIADKDLAKGSFILGRPLHNTHQSIYIQEIDHLTSLIALTPLFSCLSHFSVRYFVGVRIEKGESKRVFGSSFHF